ncbi:MAG: peptide deformylase [Flavobacteriales bacterium]|jgi:peptide deformylase
MAVLPIVRFPHDALTTAAEPVVTFDDDLRALIDNMAETMYAAEGVGLAANQVAVLKRVTVIDPAGVDEQAELLELVNPEIVEKSDEPLDWEEGCLSFPQLFGKVTRSNKVTVRYQDRNGAVQHVTAEGLLAVALQHEIDHLDGVLFIDHFDRIGRVKAIKKFEEIMKTRREEGLEPA